MDELNLINFELHIMFTVANCDYGICGFCAVSVPVLIYFDSKYEIN